MCILCIEVDGPAESKRERERVSEMTKLVVKINGDQHRSWDLLGSLGKPAEDAWSFNTTYKDPQDSRCQECAWDRQSQHRKAMLGIRKECGRSMKILSHSPTLAAVEAGISCGILIFFHSNALRSLRGVGFCASPVPSGYVKIALENGPVEIVSFRMKKIPPKKQ